jgi:hypothetical protein
MKGIPSGILCEDYIFEHKNPIPTNNALWYGSLRKQRLEV